MKEAICPHCESPIATLKVIKVNAPETIYTGWQCLVLACPGCLKALGAQVDPYSVKDVLTRRGRELD